MGTREEEIGKFFDDISDEYSSVMDEMVPHYRKVIGGMIEYLPQEFYAEDILDLGCGNGNVTALALNAFPRARMHLVDGSQEMLDICRTRFGDSIAQLENCFFQDLELKDNSVDLIVAGFSLHHLDSEEKQKFFKALYAALRPGGILACADLFVDKNSAQHEPLLKYWKAFSMNSGKTEEDWNWLMEHYDAYDRPDPFEVQSSWLAEAGFYKVDLSWEEMHFGCFHAHKRC